LDARLYEGMFLIDAAKGGSDFSAAVRQIAGLLQRHGAQIERVEKWADNKLAYLIRQVERGIYVLVHFRLDPQLVAEVRRDFTLSEEVLRVLILRADSVPEMRGHIYSPEGKALETAQPQPEAAAAPEAVGGAGAEHKNDQVPMTKLQ